MHLSPTKRMGFTLVEMIATLVILGILAAVAIPYYFDLQQESERKAAVSSVAEAQGRIHTRFGQLILQGATCDEAIRGVNTLDKIADSTEGGNLVGDFFLESATITEKGTPVTATGRQSGHRLADVARLSVPICTPTDETSGGGSGETGGSEDTTDDYIKEVGSSSWKELCESILHGNNPYGLTLQSGMLIEADGETYIVRWNQYLSTATAQNFINNIQGSGINLIPLNTASANWAQHESDNKWSTPLTYGSLYKDPASGVVYAFAGQYSTVWENLPPAGNWIKIIAAN